MMSSMSFNNEQMNSFITNQSMSSKRSSARSSQSSKSGSSIRSHSSPQISAISRKSSLNIPDISSSSVQMNGMSSIGLASSSSSCADFGAALNSSYDEEIKLLAGKINFADDSNLVGLKRKADCSFDRKT